MKKPSITIDWIEYRIQGFYIDMICVPDSHDISFNEISIEEMLAAERVKCKKVENLLIKPMIQP